MLPLVQHGELEGALVVPRAGRRTHLSLEELEALRRFGRHLSGFVAVLCADARAQRRATDARVAETRAQAELAAAHAELTRLARETRALRAGLALDRLQVPLVTLQRGDARLIAMLDAACERQRRAALADRERGLPVAELAQLVHARSPRAAQPFVIGECAALRPEQSAAWLFGVQGDVAGGMLRLAAEGTLLLLDLPALPLDVQAALARALRERRVDARRRRRLRLRRARARSVPPRSGTARRRRRARSASCSHASPRACACRRCASAPKTCRR